MGISRRLDAHWWTAVRGTFSGDRWFAYREDTLGYVCTSISRHANYDVCPKYGDREYRWRPDSYKIVTRSYVRLNITPYAAMEAALEQLC